MPWEVLGPLPTYEAIVAVIMVFVMLFVTRRWWVQGSVLAAVVAAACLALTFGAGLYIGGPLILLGTVIGFVWGWFARTRNVE